MKKRIFVDEFKDFIQSLNSSKRATGRGQDLVDAEKIEKHKSKNHDSRL